MSVVTPLTTKRTKKQQGHHPVKGSPYFQTSPSRNHSNSWVLRQADKHGINCCHACLLRERRACSCVWTLLPGRGLNRISGLHRTTCVASIWNLLLRTHFGSTFLLSGARVDKLMGLFWILLEARGPKFLTTPSFNERLCLLFTRGTPPRVTARRPDTTAYAKCKIQSRKLPVTEHPRQTQIPGFGRCPTGKVVASISVNICVYLCTEKPRPAIPKPP